MMGVVKLYDPTNAFLGEAPYFGGNRIVFDDVGRNCWVDRAELVHSSGLTRVVWGNGGSESDAPYRLLAGRRFHLDWSDEHLAALKERVSLAGENQYHITIRRPQCVP